MIIINLQQNVNTKFMTNDVDPGKQISPGRPALLFRPKTRARPIALVRISWKKIAYTASDAIIRDRVTCVRTGEIEWDFPQSLHQDT